MRGFIVSLTALLGIAAVLVFASLAFSFFSGGSRSSSLLGWQGEPFLAGIDSFVTGIYNIMVYISSWVAIFVLLVGFLGVQLMFGYAYLKVVQFFLQFREGFKKIMDDLLDI